MLTPVASTGDLLREARTHAELSVRALADRAEVAGTTVTRIESGQVDPGVETLTRLLRACGRDLELHSSPHDGPSVASLADAWSAGEARAARPDWTRLRSFLDYLDRHPAERRQATLAEPTPSGSPLIDNLLAALAETLSDDEHLPPPRWTTRVRPLTEEWASPGTPRMRSAAQSATPPRFKRRGIVLARNSLWRSEPSNHVARSA